MKNNIKILFLTLISFINIQEVISSSHEKNPASPPAKLLVNIDFLDSKNVIMNNLRKGKETLPKDIAGMLTALEKPSKEIIIKTGLSTGDSARILGYLDMIKFDLNITSLDSEKARNVDKFGQTVVNLIENNSVTLNSAIFALSNMGLGFEDD